MNKEDEKVLVIPRNVFFENGSWQGIKRDDLNYYLELIRNNSFFKRRGDVEEDPAYLQIIPYIVFSFKDKFFLYKYIKKAGEKRLVNHYQLAVGGHINEIDVQEKEDILEKAALREWQEEVDFQDIILNKKLIGILNDDKRIVERVHLGMIYHFVGESENISVKETDKIEGEMVSKKDIAKYVEDIEGWGPIVWRDYISQL